MRKTIRIFVFFIIAGICLLARLYLDAQFDDLFPREGIETGLWDTLMLDATGAFREEYREVEND